MTDYRVQEGRQWPSRLITEPTGPHREGKREDIAEKTDTRGMKHRNRRSRRAGVAALKGIRGRVFRVWETPQVLKMLGFEEQSGLQSTILVSRRMLL
jgi:hypothetical protein